MMARSMHIYTIENVAAMIGENLELLREISANSDNIDYGEMVHVHDRRGHNRLHGPRRRMHRGVPSGYPDMARRSSPVFGR